MRDSDMKVEITNSYELGLNIFFGAGLALLLCVLGVFLIDWAREKVFPTPNKAVYNISFTQDHESFSFSTADYDRSKFSGQIAFYDCATGDAIIVNPSVSVVKITKVDPKVAQSCHEVSK